MIMIGTMTFAADCAMAVAENLGRIAPVPDFMKLTGPYVRSSIEGGISTINIYERDDARADEAADYLTKRYAAFGEIKCVTANVEEWLGVGVVLRLGDATAYLRRMKLDSPVTFKEEVVQSLLITELVEAGHA